MTARDPLRTLRVAPTGRGTCCESRHLTGKLTDTADTDYELGGHGAA